MVSVESPPIVTVLPARYLTLWREKRETVLNWFDKAVMSYDRDIGLAATWAASLERLTPDGRRLLERLAYFAPDPIPDALLDVAIPSETADFDMRKAQANLFAFSLASRSSVENGKTARAGLAVHRLVQDFTKRGMLEEHRRRMLKEALDWVNEAFTGDPEDVQTWPVLDPLSLHVHLHWFITVARLESPSRLHTSTTNSACCSKRRHTMRKPNR